MAKRSFAAMKREESDIIDAILNLRSEGVLLRAAEDATSEVNTISELARLAGPNVMDS